jgi:hypothetical protein
MNTPLVLPLLKVEIYGADANILNFLLAQVSHRLTAGARVVWQARERALQT